MKKVLLVICIVICVLILSFLYIFFSKQNARSINSIQNSANTNYTYEGDNFAISRSAAWQAQTTPLIQGCEEGVIVSSKTSSTPLFKVQACNETDQKKLRALLITMTASDQKMMAYGFKPLSAKKSAIIVVYDNPEAKKYTITSIDSMINSKPQ